MRKFLLYGCIGRPSNTVVPIFVTYGLAVLAPAFISTLSPEMIKTHLHVSMCPNITAVTNLTLSPSNTGYALKGAKDSLNGLASFVGALAAGSVADKVRAPDSKLFEPLQAI